MRSMGSRSSRELWRQVMVLSVLLLFAGASMAETVTYYYTNQQGTPLATADASGNILTTSDYRPYGSQVLGSPAGGPGYTGHLNDPDSGLVYMQARYYDPVVGRFLGVDPAGIQPGTAFGFNRFSYANGNPVGNVDPDGKQAFAGWSDPQIHASEANAARFTGIVATSLPYVGDANNLAEAVREPSLFNVGMAVVGLLPEGGSLVAGAARDAKVAQLVKNAANGKAGEALSRAKLGDKIAGEQVTFKTSGGKTTRIDFVTKDKAAFETKTGNATLSKGQAEFMEDVEAGRSVTPVGQNAANAGLKPGEPTTMKSCTVDRHC